MTVKAKFKCSSAQIFEHSTKKYEFNAVCADGIPEHERFHKYSPSGKLEIFVDNPAVNFVPGKVYDLTFEEEVL
jgi:hypothetical protein